MINVCYLNNLTEKYELKTLILILLFAAAGFACRLGKSDGMMVESVYRSYYGERDSFKVWIVDGGVIREKIFGEFIYGGNDERYTFIPEREIWIDNSISAKEFETTLLHEISERNLMKTCGMSYSDAHDSALAVELQLRKKFEEECSKHESGLPAVYPVDFDSTREIENLPEKIKLENIYRVYSGKRINMDVWIVDGFGVRMNIFPDFGFSGNGLVYLFIPGNEIWIDGDVSCEETEYSILLELKEKELMKKGLYYDNAYEEALKVIDSMRASSRKLSGSRKVTVPEILFREKGTGTKKLN